MVSSVMTLLANINKPKGRRAFEAADFNPFAKREKSKGSIHDFKSLLPRQSQNGSPVRTPCPECGGTGLYQGLNAVEQCGLCHGRRFV